MAHDFNNLLTVVTGNLELLDAELEDEASRDLLRRADEAAQMGARLIGRLLTFGRQRKLRPEIINLNEIVVGMAEMLRRTIGEQVTLDTALASDLWDTLVDPSETENAILNLAINARDVMPKGGRLIIETTNAPLSKMDMAAEIGVEPRDYVTLSVSDTGSGMPPEVIARAFEPFFTTKEPGKGTGMGLATVYGLSRQSGGTATIRTETGKGTTVTLYFPRDSNGEIVVKSKASAEQFTERTGSEVILVVEDNPGVRALTVRRLGALGYKVLATENGPDAIAVLGTDEKIQLVFSDVVMAGGMSGIDIARWVREKRPGIKILLTSGFSDVADVETAAGLNIQLLRKPYKQADLARAIREALDA